MPYAMRAVIPGMTQQQYDAMMQQLGPRFRAQPGFVFHMAGPAEDGWYVIETWESQAAHEAWVREVIAPAMQAAGVAPFRQEALPLHTAFGR